MTASWACRSLEFGASSMVCLLFCSIHPRFCVTLATKLSFRTQCFIQFCAGLPVAQDLFLLLTVKRKVAYISTLKRIYFPLSVSLGKWFQEFGFQPLQFIVSSSIIYYYSFILLYFNHITRLHYAILCYAILLY